MTNINKIRSLTDCGIFQGFSWPNQLEQFEDFNLIYGWNGTGKTTIAEVLRSIERNEDPPSGFFEVEFDSGRLSSTDLPQLEPSPIRVFTKKFVEGAVFRQSGEVDPILFLGEESVEKKKEIDRLQKELDDAATTAEEAAEEEKRAKKAYDDFCKERAVRIKETLRRSGEKSRFDNYNKTDYKKACEQLGPNQTDTLLSNADCEQRKKKLVEQPLPTMKALPLPQESLNEIEDEASTLLASTVTAGALQDLQQDEKRRAWLRTGLSLHQERKTATCLFSEQPLPLGRLEDLDRHFNDQTKKLETRLDDLAARLESLSSSAPKVPDKANFYRELHDSYSEARDQIEKEDQALRSRVSELKAAIEQKKRRPFEERQLPDGPVPQLGKAIQGMNSVISEHNKIADGLADAITEAQEALEKHYVARYYGDWKTLKADAEEKETHKQSAEKARTSAQRALDDEKRKEARHGPPADQLNENLRAYLGRDELRFEIEGEGYKILRHGEPAQGLSEGERTAIALLYFLKTLRDQRFDLENGVVVLDDPVSSLDQNALFNAIAFIQECTREAGQLIVLTHNFAFFRKMRNWFHHLQRCRKKQCQFYSLRSTQEDSRRVSILGPLDETLKEFHSEYHFLFATVYRAAKDDPDKSSFDFYHLPNITRRLLEGFLSFRRPTGGSFHQRLRASSFDPEKVTRIYRFVNAHSHSGSFDPSMDEDMSILAESHAVLNDALEFIRHEAAKHYEEMKELVNDS